MDIFESDSVRLTAFAAMAHDIALSRTLAETLDRVMHHLGSVFAPRNWSLLLKDAKTGSLQFVHAAGPGAEAIAGLSLARGQGVAGWVAENGQPLLIPDARADERFHAGVDEISGFVTRSVIAVPLRARHQVYGVIELINKLDESSFDDRDLVVLQTIADFAAVAIERAYFLKRARRLALTDSLTGLANRREFHLVLGREIEKTRRHGTLFSVVYLDIDRFKTINDVHGHAAGDEALRALARILQATARKVDTPARLGGDEFALLLPETTDADAPFVTRRILRALDDYNQTAPVALSVSLGLRVVDPQAPDEVLDQADRAMYDAKTRADEAGALEGRLGSWLDDEGAEG